jgi:DNA-binding CsgD family transcriptional regulator
MNSDISTYRNVSDSAKAAPWMLDWKSKQFTYIGPQIATILGWPVSSWNTLSDWTNRIHRQDREVATKFFKQQTSLGVDHETIYRATTPSGTFIWVRNIVHVIQKNDSVDSLAGFILCITSRAEDKNERIVSHEIQPKYTSTVCAVKRHYCFTVAEERLAIALLSGKRANDYANEKGISINTVRSQIRSIMEKVGVNRQTDLILTLVKAEIIAKKNASE